MPSTLQKRLGPPTAPAPATGNDSRRHSQTYAIDIVQRVRVTSDEPLTRRKIDAVKKSLGKLGLGAGDQRGCVSDDDGGAGLRVVQTALEVVRGSDAKPASSSSPPPALPLRPHSASPGGSTKQNQDPNQAAVPPKRILFYHAHDPYYGFTNFSPDPIEYRGKRYPTSEHLFQSLKVSGGEPTLTAMAVTSSKARMGSIRVCLYRGVGPNTDDAQMISCSTVPQFLDHRPELAEHIRTCSPRPRIVFDETHRFNPEVRSDWLRVRIDMVCPSPPPLLWLRTHAGGVFGVAADVEPQMDMVLWNKFTQNEHLKRELLSTGNAELVEVSDRFLFPPLSHRVRTHSRRPFIGL